MTFKRYPKTISFTFGLLYRLIIPVLIKHAKKILTVSQFSKSEILHFYPNCNNDIEVIYNAVNEKFISYDHYNPDDEFYILAVSSDYIHKNFEQLVQGVILLNHPTLKLKIVGNRGVIASKYEKEKNVEFLGRVSDEQLITLYQNAYAFIFPSLYEGFGIPPLEAQACRCPVIASNSSAMPEILKDSVIYFDPKDVNDLKEKIETLIKNKKLHAELKDKGIKNVLRFSWHDSAMKLNKIINEKR